MRLGIDLGGTKIEIIALKEDGEVLLRERVATPQNDYRATVEAVAALVEVAEKRLGRSGLPVGIGTPGAISRATGLLKNSNSVCLNGQPLLQDLEKRLGRAIRINNDGARREIRTLLDERQMTRADSVQRSVRDRRKHKIRELPGTLREALEALAKDRVIREALGSHVYEHLVQDKQLEWDSYRIAVHQWELDKYLAEY